MDKYFNRNDIVNGYKIVTMIGQGRYGIAYLAINKFGQKCVVKQLRNEMLKITRDSAIYEERILKTLNSSRFPKFISEFRDEFRQGYLLEYIDGIVFHDLINKEGHEFTREEIYEAALQLLELAEILHSQGIVHRDIRTPNVILMKNNQLALIDFGLARFIKSGYSVKTDYWYIGDFLLQLYYSTYNNIINKFERPWFEELDLTTQERIFLRRLMGLDRRYRSISEIRNQLYKIIRLNSRITMYQ